MTIEAIRNRPSKHCHKLVAETARAMCHELFDTLMHDNAWYDVWRRQNPGMSARQLEAAFVARNWGRLVQSARATLAAMLSGPYDDATKTRVYEALCLDNTLIRGRGASAALHEATETKGEA